MGTDRRELGAIFVGGGLGALARAGLAEAFPVDPDSTHLLQLLNHVHHHVAKRVSVAVGGSGRLDEWAVLSVLSDGAGHPMREIADITHSPPPTMTKLINRLVTGGLVYRRTDPLDRRRVLVFPTARGRSRYRRLRSLVDASVASLADDEELRELVSELHRRISEVRPSNRQKINTVVTRATRYRLFADEPPRVRLNRHCYDPGNGTRGDAARLIGVPYKGAASHQKKAPHAARAPLRRSRTTSTLLTVTDGLGSDVLCQL